MTPDQPAASETPVDTFHRYKETIATLRAERASLTQDLTAARAERDKLEVLLLEYKTQLGCPSCRRFEAERDAARAQLAEAQRVIQESKSARLYVHTRLEGEKEQTARLQAALDAMTKEQDGWKEDARKELTAARQEADRLRLALMALLSNVSNIEVLGEWEALEINPNSRIKLRPKVDAVIEQARAALSPTDSVFR